MCSTATATSSPPRLRYIWTIIGPAGCGKSTIAQFLSSTLDLPYIEGDNFHPSENIAKMASGIPLTDEDRWGWLGALRDAAVATLRGDAGADGCIVTCSCLKRRYRDVIRAAAAAASQSQSQSHGAVAVVVVRFMYLRADEELVLARVRARQGHYMKDAMVRSQFADLEEPARDEADVVTVDVSGTKADGQSEALGKVLQGMGMGRSE